MPEKTPEEILADAPDAPDAPEPPPVLILEVIRPDSTLFFAGARAGDLILIHEDPGMQSAWRVHLENGDVMRVASATRSEWRDIGVLRVVPDMDGTRKARIAYDEGAITAQAALSVARYAMDERPSEGPYGPGATARAYRSLPSTRC
jgi:hypothetical protein